MTLLELAASVEAASGASRELDALIAEHAYGWKPIKIGADYDGANECEVLTPGGAKIDGFSYPNRGIVPRWYHVPPFTRDTADPDVPRDYVRKKLAASLRALAHKEKNDA